MAAEDIEVRIKVAIDAAEAASTVGEVRTSMKTLKSLALEVGDTSSESFRKISSAIGETNDKVGDINQSFKSLSGEPIENIRNSFMLLKDSIVKLDLKSAKIAFNNLGTSISAMGKVLLANPLFAIAAVVAAVVVALYQLKDAGGVVTQIFEAVGDVLNQVIQYLKDLSDSFGLSAFAATEAADKTIASLKRTREAIEETADFEIAKRAAAGKETFDLEKKKNKDLLENNQKEIDALGKKFGMAKEWTDEQHKQYDELLGLRVKYSNAIDVLDIKEDKYQYDKKKKKKDDDKKDNEEKKKKAEDAYKAEQKRLSDLVDLRAQQELLYIQSTKTGESERQAVFDLEFESRAEKMRAAGVSEANITRLNAEGKAAIHQEFIDKEQKAEDDAAKRKKELAQEVADNDKRLADEAKKRMEEDNAIIIAGAQALAGTLNAIGNLVAELDSNREKKTVEERNKAAKKQFQLQKALGIVSAGINTAQAIMQALGGFPPPASFIFAALAGVTGAIQIATIAAKQFHPEQASTSGGGGAAPTIPSTSAVSAAATQATAPKASAFFGLGQNQLVSKRGEFDQRVYVVESDITNSQRKVKTIQNRGELGG